MTSTLGCTSGVANVPHTCQALGGFRRWTAVDLNMNARGPFNIMDEPFTNTVIAVGCTRFMLAVTITDVHDVNVILHHCNPETGADLGNFGAATLLSNEVDVATASVLIPWPTPDDAAPALEGVFHSFFIVFSFNNAGAATFVTASLQGSA